MKAGKTPKRKLGAAKLAPAEATGKTHQSAPSPPSGDDAAFAKVASLLMDALAPTNGLSRRVTLGTNPFAVGLASRVARPAASSVSKTVARLALELLKYPELRAKLDKEISARQHAEALASQFRGEHIVFDFAEDSLQARLLAYMKAHFGFTSGEEALQEAEKRRKLLLGKIEKEVALGWNSHNKDLLPLVEGYTDLDLRELNNAVRYADHGESFKKPEVVQIVTQKFTEGRGKDLIKYMAKRLESHEKRMASDPWPWMEVFHPALTIIAYLWTSPDAPLWMMPSAGAVNIINKLLKPFGEKDIEQTNFDTLTRSHNLRRLAPELVSQFISLKVEDATGRALQKELEEVMGIKLENVRRGARQKRVIAAKTK